MFDALKSFFDEMRGAPTERPFDADDHRIAAAALLIHIANADGHVDEPERHRLHRIIEDKFQLDPPTANKLIAFAEESEREAVDLYHFTSVLRRALDAEGRRAVVGLLWDMAYADGAVHEFEENIVWRISELLGVSPRDRIALRQNAEATGPETKDSATSGPWSGGKAAS